MGDDDVMYVAGWSQHRDGNKNVIELEGKTKRLVRNIAVCAETGSEEVDDNETPLLPFIPEFQGAWMRVRITVELIPSELVGE